MDRGSRTGLWLAAAFALAASPAQAAPGEAATASSPWTLPRSLVRDMVSPSGGAYRIFIAWPETPPPRAGWPILYLLDGDEAFPTAATVATAFGPYIGLEPGIVVGIGYGGKSRRGFDYTPPAPADVEALLPEGRSGGADSLLDFIASRVRPAVEARLPVDRDRQTLAGYSLGGLFVLHALLARPGLFRTYVAASPSIWVAAPSLRDGEAGLARRLGKGRDIRLFITAGELEQAPPPRLPGDSAAQWSARARLTERARMVDRARETAARLAGLRSGGLRVSFRVMPGETHASGAFENIREALKDAFGPAPSPDRPQLHHRAP